MYNDDNIARIKRSGQLNAYIEMERRLVAALDGAEMIEAQDGRLTVAHLIGYYGIEAEGRSEPHAASTLQSTEWSREWPVSRFESQTAAKAYARAATRNALWTQAADVLAKARERLAALEAAQ